MKTKKHQLPKQYNRALIVPETLNIDTREVDVTFATETPCFRFGWSEDYNEVLSCQPSAVRMERINKGLPVLNSHDSWSLKSQIGRTTKVWFTDKTICARVLLSKRPEVETLLQDIKDGIIRDISVGYRVYKFEREPAAEGAIPTYIAIDWMPNEISFVSVPADTNCGVRSDKTETNAVQLINNHNIKSEQMKVKVNCPECGHTFETDKAEKYTCPECEAEFDASDDDDTKTDTKGKKSLTNNDCPPPVVVDVEAIRSQVTTEEQKRLDAILTSTRAAKLDDTIAIELYKSKRPIDECRHEIILKAAADSPFNANPVNGHHNANVGLEGIEKKREAAIDAILARNLPDRFKVKKDNPFIGMRYVVIARELFEERGVSTRGKSDSQVAEMVFSQRAYGTSDLPLLMENVMNKILRGDYQFMPEHWTKISRKKLVPDYRPAPFYQFETLNGMQPIAEGGEIKYTKMIESKQTIQVKDYGEGFKMTRQSIINDDLDVFAEIPDRFMMDREEMQGDNVWGLIIDNVKMDDQKTLFHADHKNLITGANSTLTETGLKNSLQKFREQKGLGDKRRINVEPKYLIVPPALEVTARKLLTAITASTVADVNVFQNAYEIIVERRLTDDDAWYLIADPARLACLFYAYLEGEEGIRAERKEDFNTDTINYGVRCNFGVAAIDWRGIVKNTGR